MSQLSQNSSISQPKCSILLCKSPTLATARDIFHTLLISLRTWVDLIHLIDCLSRADLYKVFEFGLPAAAILTTALQDMTRDPSKNLPASINRAILIRNISVLISHLESVIAYGDIQSKDLASCRQASKSISHRLDQILEGVFSGSTTVGPPNLVERLDSSSVEHCNNFSTFVPTQGEAIGLEGVDDFDFDTWASTIGFDLETTRHDWNIF